MAITTKESKEESGALAELNRGIAQDQVFNQAMDWLTGPIIFSNPTTCSRSAEFN